jgi:hypothetical protein
MKNNRLTAMVSFFAQAAFAVPGLHSTVQDVETSLNTAKTEASSIASTSAFPEDHS